MALPREAGRVTEIKTMRRLYAELRERKEADGAGYARLAAQLRRDAREDHVNG